jgi:hypothetical protein
MNSRSRKCWQCQHLYFDLMTTWTVGSANTFGICALRAYPKRNQVTHEVKL